MRVFLSYRRDDTRDVVGRIADKLRATPGVSKVFMDVEDIGGGENFVRSIQKGMRQARVRLVVLGQHWTSLADASGQPRIRAMGDHVAAEVRTALQTKGRVIPVLVNGARMPSAAELPPELAPLTQLNAVPLRHETFDSDFVLLTNVMFNRRSARGLAAYFERHPVQAALLRGVLGFAVTGIALVAALMAIRAFGLVSGPIGGSREAAVFIAAAVMIVGTFAPVLLGGAKRRRSV
jgi:hypothetical protein